MVGETVVEVLDSTGHPLVKVKTASKAWVYGDKAVVQLVDLPGEWELTRLAVVP